MSKIKVDTWENSGGLENYPCTAWVNFNGTGTVAIIDSGNVSSITDNAVGKYTANFATAMSNANYSVSGSNVGSTTASDWWAGVYSQKIANTTSSCSITVSQVTFGPTDQNTVHVQVFGGR